MPNKREPNARAPRGRAVRRRPLAREPDQRSAARVAELERDLEHYRNLFDNAPIPCVMLDPVGVIVDANLTVAGLVNRPRKALLHRPLVRMLVERDRKAFYDHMRRCRRETSARTEVHLEASGDSVPVEIDSHLVPDTADETLRFHTTIIDLRERYQAEEARLAAIRERHHAEEREHEAHALNEAKDRFLAELSHELRTPLTPIVAAVTTMTNEPRLPGELRSTIEMIRRNLEAEVRLIDELLDVSRIGGRRPQLQLEAVDSHATIRQVAGELESEFRAKRIALSLRLDAREARILGDPVRLHQIVWNVVSNALYNSNSEGSVVIATSNIQDDLRIVVRDDGVGIAPDQLDNIFRPFFREDGKRGAGLGLGLAIVKGLVEAHHGRVRAFSEGKGKGATFAIEFPLPALDQLPRAVKPPPAVSTPGRSVLLVEDHADTREALQMFLEMKGYVVRLAHDVRSALEAAREPFDVVVCDIGLPDGTGFDVMRKISGARSVKGIALTGYGGPREQQLATEAGFTNHLTKPVGGDKLVQTIESLFAN